MPPPLAMFDADGDAYAMDSWREWGQWSGGQWSGPDNSTATGVALFAITCVLSILATGAMGVCAYMCLGRPRTRVFAAGDHDLDLPEDDLEDPRQPRPPPQVVKVVNHPDGSVVLAMRPRAAAAPAR